MKDKIRSYLSRNWVIYAVFAAISILSVSFAGVYLGKTKEEEKIDILLVSESYDHQEFDNYLTTIKPDYLKELNYRYVSPSDGYFSQILGTYGAVEADLFFVSFSKLEEINCASLMLPLEQTKVNEIYGEGHAYYSSDGYTYGIAISPHGFSNEKNEVYYACFAQTSLHLGKLNGSELDGALEVVRAFL